MASNYTSGRFQGFDSSGNPLSGGLLYTYTSGTLTPLSTYTTQLGGVANSNPVVLDSAGRAQVWLGASSYRMILKSAAGATVTDDDNLSPYSSNAVTFIAARELQTATASQTVFTLATSSYEVGGGSLLVIVDGAILPATDYTETSANVVTFSSGLLVGQQVEFMTGRLVAAAISADAVVYAAAGSASTARSVQSVIRDMGVSVADKGAVVAVDCAAAVTNAAAAGSEVIFPAGAWTAATTPTITGAKIITAQPGSSFGGDLTLLGLTGGCSQQTIQQNTSGADFATQYFRRNTNHTGGASGWVSSCVNIASFVQPGNVNHEWALTSVMHNYSSTGENVAGYLQGRKHSTGWTWGAVIEVLDCTGVENPSAGAIIGLELDVNCNGGDANAYRIGMDLAIRKTPVGLGGTGVAAEVTNGYRIQNGGDTDSIVYNGYGFQTGMNAIVGFSTHGANITQAAFKMAEGQNISFNAGATRQLSHNGGGWLFQNNTGTTYWALNDNLSLTSNGVQLLGSRRTGWAAATGTATRTTFDTATVTTALLAQRVKALIDDLTLHGLIGA